MVLKGVFYKRSVLLQVQDGVLVNGVSLRAALAELHARAALTAGPKGLAEARDHLDTAETHEPNYVPGHGLRVSRGTKATERTRAEARQKLCTAQSMQFECP